MGSIVFSSDEDLPLSPGQEDRRKVRKRDTRPLSQPGLIDGPTTEPTPGERPVETITDSLMDKPPEAELPAWSDTKIMPLIIIENSSVVEKPPKTQNCYNFGLHVNICMKFGILMASYVTNHTKCRDISRFL